MPVLQLGNHHEALATEDAACHLDLSKLIQAGTKTFFNNPVLSDITLVCPDGRALHCHSVILAAASRRFAAALKQGDWTPGQQMPVKGVDSDALETLVCAFYTAECPLELARVPALYDAAVKLEVPSLAPALEQYLSSALHTHNCCQVLELCLNRGVMKLADLALEWIRGRVGDVVPSSEFRSCRLETAACIVKDLAQRSQLVGLQAAVSWLAAGAARGSLVGVFAEATGLSVDAIQAIAVSGSLGSLGLSAAAGGGSGSGRDTALQLSHGHGGGGGGGLQSLVHGGHGSALLAAAATGPSLNLQAQGHVGPGLGGGGGGHAGESLRDGLGGLGLGLAGHGGGGVGNGGAGVQVLQLLPAGGGSQAVLVMPQGAGGGGMSGDSGMGGLQSLLLHPGGVGMKGAGGGPGGGGSGNAAAAATAAGLAMPLSGAAGPQGYGLDALADAAEGERVQKRLRAAAGAAGVGMGVGGGLGGGVGVRGGGGGPPRQGSFAVVTAESGSATSMHSDMSGDAPRMGSLDEPHHSLQRGALHREPDPQSQQQQHPQQHFQQQQQHLVGGQRGKVAGGRGGGRRKRGGSATDDDEDYAPNGGRSGGGGSSRSRAQDLVYDAEALLDGNSGGGGGASAGSGHGEDDGPAGAGGSGGGGTQQAGSGGGGRAGGGTQGATPVLMTGRRAPSQKGMCHVQGCHRSLAGLRDYYQRYKICEHHLKVSQVLKDGIPHRFCQQCGRFHPLSEFDGDRRSCRTMLQRHCHRRAKQKQELAEVLAQRIEEKQVAASMSAVVAAMARGAQASSIAGLPPILQLQYLAGLPAAAAAAAAAALDDEQLSALGAVAMNAVRGGADGGGGRGGGRSALPPGLHSPPSKAQLLEAVQRARKQHLVAQHQLLGLTAGGADGEVAAAGLGPGPEGDGGGSGEGDRNGEGDGFVGCDGPNDGGGGWHCLSTQQQQQQRQKQTGGGSGAAAAAAPNWDGAVATALHGPAGGGAGDAGAPGGRSSDAAGAGGAVATALASLKAEDEAGAATEGYRGAAAGPRAGGHDGLQ